MTARLVYETHSHTPLCRHAEGMPEDYAAVAERRGLRGIIFTCHNPMPDSYGHSGRMEQVELPIYFDIVEAAREEFEGRVDVRMGLECDFFPGYEGHVAAQLDRQPFHYVLGSVHPHLPIWRRRYGKGGSQTAWEHYFSQLADAAETGLFDCISHPDLIKNQTAEDWSFDRAANLIAASLDRIARAGAAMELNTSGLLKHIHEMNPCPPMLGMMAQRGIPVVVGGDAHEPGRVGDQFEQAFDLLEAAGFAHVSHFIYRQRHDLPIAEARASLAESPDAVP